MMKNKQETIKSANILPTATVGRDDDGAMTHYDYKRES